jgi:glutamyl-tRNA reductase
VTRETAARLGEVLLLDLGVPANVAEECAAVPGVEVVAQRSLESEATANREARTREIGIACEIVRQQLDELAYELMEHELSPVARRLLSRFREVTRMELERAVEGCAPHKRAEIEEMADRLSQRLVRVPMRGLREIAWMHSTAVLDTFLSAVEG